VTRRGFTLLEIVVSLAILAVIATITFVTMANAMRAREVLEEEDVVNRSARVALSTIRRELSLAYLSTNISAVNTYRTVFVAKDNNPDLLIFTPLSHTRRYRDAREGDQTEVTYWLEDDPVHSGASVLLHREAPRIDQEPDKGGLIEPLAYNVHSFDLRYIDPTTNEWKEEWDTTGTVTPERLPRAVQVVLVLLAPDPNDDSRSVEKTFATTVVLQFADVLKHQGASTE
jgi:general secretion pathway protein J